VKIAIASGKGGTGKTSLSTNLAAMWSKEEPVVLCDLDVEEPNSALFFHAELIRQEVKFKKIPVWKEDTCSLCGQCKDVCNFNAIIKLGKKIMVFPELCHSCHACSELCPTSSLPMKDYRMGELKHFHDGPLNFIESKLDIGQEQAVPLIRQTLNYLDQHFDKDLISILDSPPGTSCPVIEATKDADFVILITEPTPFGFHDLKLAVETMEELGKQFGVVINRHGIGNSAVEEYCLENEIPLIAKIPNKREIAELYAKGKLVYPHVNEFREAILQVKMYLQEHIL
jgi:MinD superfamily P-loop ATPase